ncbi:ExbD/TolR family protein [Porphyrobacter sp. AAP82]|uniref:ExbD/TolR family protein n=1 Tax=Porphyrobacter sp. AAP82 TaxID=1248917 RepID=UPI000307B6BB|nr:biopolymer transporter ExbD [Porphyrobacter sp. AAP82]
MPHPSLRRSPAPRRFDHGEPIRAIDTRPMLFVALFIAVVFLLAASQTRQHALLVELPSPYEETGEIRDFNFVLKIRVTNEGDTLLNGVPVTAKQLTFWLEQANELNPLPDIVFEPDANAPYDAALQALGLVWKAGLIDGRLGAFCINGMEKHGDFGKASGHPLPLLTTLVPQEEIVPPRNPPMPELPDVDTCAPAHPAPPGR